MKLSILFLFSSLWLSCTILSCNADPTTFTLKSPAITDQRILTLYTCDGENTSPAIFWSGEPIETKSYVLIVRDLDAPNDPSSPDGSFVHWTIYNIPGKFNHLPKGMSRDKKLPNGSMQGKNSFHRCGYDGPCPPANETHRYTFTLYALDTMLEVKKGAAMDDLQHAMNMHIIATAQLMGTYVSTSSKERTMSLDRPNMLLEN